MSNSPYDELYRSAPDFFGKGPVRVLVDHVHLLAEGSPVLDIGAGQGRNTFYLARLGFPVVAIDTSNVGVQMILDAAARGNLPVKAIHAGFADFSPDVDHFAGILVFGLIQVLDRPSIRILLNKLRDWTSAGSLVFVTAFTTQDPEFEDFKKSGKKIGENSFVIKKRAGDEVRTFLEKNEILELFGGWEVVHHWEGLGPEHMHPGGLLERHGSVEAVFRR